MGIERDSQKLIQERILVITAVQEECNAVLRGIKGDARFEVVAAGVGPAASAAGTARLLALSRYQLVVSAGIGGGFPDRAPLGSIVVANRIIAADLGAETPEGFCSVEQLGFGSNCLQAYSPLAGNLYRALEAAGLTAVTGPVLTVSTVTGTAERAAELANRVPGAVAEAMEGFGVAVAAVAAGVPVLELRAVSNAVGPRDRAAWKIAEALDSLAQSFTVLAEVLP